MPTSRGTASGGSTHIWWPLGQNTVTKHAMATKLDSMMGDTCIVYQSDVQAALDKIGNPKQVLTHFL